MEEKLLLGKNVADSIKENLKVRVEEFKNKGIEPALGIIRVGDNPDDLAYQKGAIKALESVGIKVDVHPLPEDRDSAKARRLFEFSSARHRRARKNARAYHR